MPGRSAHTHAPTNRPAEPSPPARTSLAARWIEQATSIQRRILITLFATFGPRFAYALTAALAHLLYRLLPPLRAWSERNIRQALGDRLATARIERLARDAFVHRIWNLTDLLLAERFLRRGDLDRYGGRIPPAELERLKRARARGQAYLLLTGYYGPFDLLPLLLGWNGVPTPIVYRPHANRPFDRFRQRVRSASGCELIPLSQALLRVPALLESGRGVALLVDHYARRAGLTVQFLGAPTTITRALGILAIRHRADVVVAAIRRVGRQFRFEVEVAEVIDHEEFAQRDDAVDYVLRRYLQALERIILRDPAQYLWLHDRWGVLQQASAESEPPGEDAEDGESSASGE